MPLVWLPAEPVEPPRKAQAPIAIPSKHAPLTAVALETLPERTAVLPAERSAWRLSAITWQGWLLVGWAAVVAIQIVRLVVLRRRLSALLREATPAGGQLSAAVAQVGRQLRLARLPTVLLVDMDCSPFVCGVLRPAIVLPRGLAESLNGDELCQVLAHELAHLKRGDLVWGWTVEIARLVYFFNPVIHYVAYRARLERELACDQMAMQHSGRGPAEYAQTLVRVLSAASSPSVFRTSAAASLDGGDASLGQQERGR